MNIVRDSIHNAILGVPAIRRWAAKKQRTGIDGDPVRARKTLDYFASKVPIHGKRILEIGPGKTLDLLRLALDDGAAACSAVDIIELLDPVSAAAQGIDYQIYDGRRLPHDDGAFDLVIAADVFEHLRYPEITVPEIHRVLSDGGHVITLINLKDHYYDWHHPESEWLNFLRYSPAAWWAMTSNRSAFCNRLRYSDWKALFQDSQFREIEIKRRPRITCTFDRRIGGVERAQYFVDDLRRDRCFLSIDCCLDLRVGELCG